MGSEMCIRDSPCPTDPLECRNTGAEGVGFEPTVRGNRTTVFKTVAFGRSASPPGGAHCASDRAIHLLSEPPVDGPSGRDHGQLVEGRHPRDERVVRCDRPDVGMGDGGTDVKGGEWAEHRRRHRCDLEGLVREP